jgi:hypothetical protein
MDRLETRLVVPDDSVFGRDLVVLEPNWYSGWYPRTVGQVGALARVCASRISSDSSERFSPCRFCAGRNLGRN